MSGNYPDGVNQQVFDDAHDEMDDDFDDDEYCDDLDFDCGMDRNGMCGKAGSEECDFECPYRDELND